VKKVTHMMIRHGFDPEPYAYCGSRSKVFNAPTERATCKRCWANHERVMKIIRAERAAKKAKS
jgi:hypothetical protein